MDSSFWLGIIIAAIVGLASNLLANYATPSFNDFVNKRKAAWIERSRTNAIRKYKTIIALKNGEKNAAAYFTRAWAIFLLIMGFLFTMTVIGVDYAGHHGLRTQIPATLGELILEHDGQALFIAVVQIGAGILGAIRYISIALTEYRLDAFAEYEKALKERWGEES